MKDKLPLYQSDDRFTNEGSQVFSEFFKTNEQQFQNWAKVYSVRVLSHLLQSAIVDMENEAMLDMVREKKDPG